MNMLGRFARKATAAGLGLLVLAFSLPAPGATIRSVGAVTWHVKGYIGKTIELRGYVLAIGPTLVLFSDEPSGAVSAHDLPIEGPGTDQLVLRKRYVLTGVLTGDAVPVTNGSRVHLELTGAPVIVSP